MAILFNETSILWLELRTYLKMKTFSHILIQKMFWHESIKWCQSWDVCRITFSDEYLVNKYGTMVSICFSIVCMTTATRVFRYLVNKDGSMVNVCSSICTTHCCKCNVTSPTRFHKISPSIKTMQPIVCTYLFLI